MIARQLSDSAIDWIKELELFTEKISADPPTFLTTRKLSARNNNFSYILLSGNISIVLLIFSRLPALRDIQILNSDMKQKQAESIMLYVVEVIKKKKSKKVQIKIKLKP